MKHWTLWACAFRQLTGMYLTGTKTFHTKINQKYSHETQFGHCMNQCSAHTVIARKLFPNVVKLTKVQSLMCLKSTLYNVQVQVKTLGVPRNVQQFQPNFVTADTLSR